MKAQRRPILITFVLAYIFYVAIETSSSGWMATQLRGVGYSESVGSLVTAGFWCGMAVGRSLGGPLFHWLAEKKLVLGGLTLAIVLCLLATANPVAPYAYPALGLIIASIFPMGLIWYTLLCPHDSDGLSTLIFFMMIGGVAGPGAIACWCRTLAYTPWRPLSPCSPSLTWLSSRARCGFDQSSFLRSRVRRCNR